MIEFQKVTFCYHYDKYPLFEELTFALPQGQSTVLCDVQSGKTTLCKLILGKLVPNSGTVTVDGAVVGKNGVVPDILYLPSQPVFFENRSVLFNLRYPCKVRKTLPQNDKKIFEIAQQFGFSMLLKTKVKKLSQSQKKILALARGLTVQRDIVLFDCFFDDTNQDEHLQRQNVLELFRNCKAIVQVTDNPEFAFGETVVLDDKKCAFQGQSDKAQQFVCSLEWLASKL